MDSIFIKPDKIPNEIVIAISKRHGGVSKGVYKSLNTALHVGDKKEDVLENRKIFFNAIGIDYKKAIFLNQVHSNDVYKVEEKDIVDGSRSEEYAITSDSVITNIRQVPIVIQTADCLSIAVYSPSSNSIANIHAGWPSLSSGIIQNTIDKMKECFNTETKDMYVYLGARISKDNFEVGKEVADKFSFAEEINNKYYVDLALEAKSIFLQYGVSELNIIDSKLNSFDYHFFSYRRDKKITGRMSTVIMLK